MEQYNSVDYSYAVTNYKAQGMGVDFVVADMPTTCRGQNRNAAYVDLSPSQAESHRIYRQQGAAGEADEGVCEEDILP